MKKQSFFWLILLIIPLLFSTCKKEEDLPGENGSSWLIPVGEIFDGGPGKDGIPSVDNPIFAEIDDITYLEENDLVIVVKFGNTIKVYPHPILDWHEIINDDINGLKLAITYCPLTGTAIGWKRTIDGKLTTFGVSGLLYNSNLIPYDRATDSNWSQIRLDCVNGELQSTKIETYQMLETSWKTLKTLYPEAEVMTTQTGYSRNYGSYPYGTYQTSNNFIFQPSPVDNRIHVKERVLGIIEDKNAKAYRFGLFPGEETTLVTDFFAGKELIIAGSTERNFLIAFYSKVSDGTILSFTALENEFPLVMEDNEGNKWNIFGEAVEGPRAGEKLEAPESFIGYWFSFGAFYPDLPIYE